MSDCRASSSSERIAKRRTGPACIASNAHTGSVLGGKVIPGDHSKGTTRYERFLIIMGGTYTRGRVKRPVETDRSPMTKWEVVMRHRLWMIPAALLSSFALDSGAAAESSGPYDVLSYRLAVTIDFDQSPGPESPYRSLLSVLNELQAEATLRLTNVSDQPQDEISLILHRLMSASEIESGGEALTFEQQLRGLEGWENFHVHHLKVRWAEPLAPGEEATLTIRYAGQLVGYPEVGMLYVRETLDPEFTILRYETFCYPQVSQPERDAVHAARRFDTFDQVVEVTVPDGHVVITGGRSTGIEEKDGQTTYAFSSYEPEGIFLVPVAPYKVATSGPHRIFHFEGSTQGVEALQVNLERVMALFTTWFGPPRLERGLTIAEIPEFFGSQSGSFILQTSGAFNNPDQYNEFYHELSHLWNPRDTDPKPCRWNEGLATFLEGVVEDHLGGQGHLDERLSGIFSRLKTALDKDEKLRTVAMVDYGKEDMAPRSYSTGALFFGLLRDRVGEEALLAFVRDYSQRHHESGSTDQAFAEAIVSALGEGSRDIVHDWFLTPAFVEKLTGAESWDDLKSSYR